MAKEESKAVAKNKKKDDLSAFSLRHTLRGHENVIWQIAWSPDGHILASSSQDKTIRLWNGQSGKLLETLAGQSERIISIAWSPDGRTLASAGSSNTIRLWDGQTRKLLQTLEGHRDIIDSVAWSPDGHILASGSSDETIRLWDGQSGKLLQILEGHTDMIYSLAWSPDGHILASSSPDNTIRLWDGKSGKLLQILEGHTETVSCVSFSFDGHFLASKSLDNTVRIWRAPSWETIEVFKELCSDLAPLGLAFHPHTSILATLGEKDKIVHIWDVNFTALQEKSLAVSSVHYTTAKIALVGDPTVGKSGLGYRIAKDRYDRTESTHGQQFWVVDKLGATRSDGTLCEAILWDFAGQLNYRPIHALFLDDIDLALILFDSSRPDTLSSGVVFWLKQLVYQQQRCRTILVAGRVDVSPLSISTNELDTFCREQGISGGFIATSAKTKAGIDALLERIRQQIDWDAKPTTITTETFKRVKDYVLKLKGDADRSKVLVNFEELRHSLEATDANWHFSDAELVGSAGHLQNHGYITILRRSSDEQSILLAPDILINLASSIMLKAQANEKGLGSLEEAGALRNDYHFQELEALSEDEHQTLLNAAVELFLNRNICFRESVDGQTFLIFPSLILERPPRLTASVDLVDDITYIVTGQVENVYAALVVLLGYSPTFQRINQWHKQAQYERARGEICGFKLANDEHGELELVLYHGKATPDYVRLRFQGLFEEILHARNVMAHKYAPVVCPKCGRQQARSTVIQRINEGKTFLFCDEDGRKISLKQPERLVMSSESRALVDRDQALITMRTSYETALSSIKKFVQERKSAAPTCFISYAWGNEVQSRWVLTLADDLRKADLGVVIDQLDNTVFGASVPDFINSIEKCDFILVIGTPAYRQKYDNNGSVRGSIVAAEGILIDKRMVGTKKQKASIVPLLLNGEETTSFPPLLQGKVYADFKHEEDYFIMLFDLLLTLYAIPVGDPLVRDLREKLRKDAYGPSAKR